MLHGLLLSKALFLCFLCSRQTKAFLFIVHCDFHKMSHPVSSAQPQLSMDLSLLRANLAGAAVLLLFHGFCSSQQQDSNYTFLKHASHAPAVSYYDYIIVGGGTAGCPLAATLSNNSTVLLLERGSSPYGNKNITHFPYFLDNLADTSSSSPSQPFISTDGVINSRARVLGGGTCIGAGFYSRASPEQVRMMGLEGKLVNESYKWVEEAVAFEPRLLQWQSAVREGLLEVGVEPDNGFTYDHVYGTKTGGTIFDRDGRRHTAADLLRYADPGRLTVLLHATVSRVLFRYQGNLRRVARGVAFHDTDGKQHIAYLNSGEVILSAGAIGSPHLLMLSGIGPMSQLKSLGIPVVLDQPMVGQGMSDNPLNFIVVPSPSPVEISLDQQVGINHFGSYIEQLSGLDLSGVLSGTARNFYINTGTIATKLAYPSSRGHLELVSANLEDSPSVTFNYFKEPEDVHTCIEGLKIITKLIESKAFSKFKYANATAESLLRDTSRIALNRRPRNQGSLTLEQYCNESVVTVWHYHGGCQVGKVVDEDYKVMGVDGIRVIDDSTFNFSPGTNPQATVMMLGRYMGLKIQNQIRGSKARENAREIIATYDV